MKKLLSLSLLFLCCSIYNHINAQKPPHNWGKVADKDLKMKVYEPDSSAAAVVLFDFGIMDLTHSFEYYQFYHHRRVKILKRTGFDYADVSIPIFGDERIANLKAQIILPSGETIKLSKKDFYKEKVTNNYIKENFTFPKLEEGAIIEYQYILYVEDFVQLKNWYFQEKIPVLWSEINLKIPEYYQYVRLTQGRQPDIQDTDFTTKRIEGSLFNVSADRAVMKDLPAFESESYMTTMSDYLPIIKYQLSGYGIGLNKKAFLTDWPSTAKKILELGGFGQQFNRKGNYKNTLKAYEAYRSGLGTDANPIESVYNFVNEQMEWNGDYWYSIPEDLDHFFELKKGNSAAINLMVLALLREEGIDAMPVLISTRNHGKMIQTYPILDQFNHVLVVVKEGEKHTLIDAGSQYRPIGFVRPNCLNYMGWVVHQDPYWIKIEAPKTAVMRIAKLDWNQNMHVTGAMSTRYEGFEAFDLAESMSGSTTADDSSQDEDSSSSTIEEKYPEAKFSAVKIKAFEVPTKKVDAEVQCTLPSIAESAGDYIYLNSILFPPFDEHPFKLKERNYPVEIPYPIAYRQVMNIPIPEGYQLEEKPESINMVMPNSGGKCVYDVMVSGNLITVNFSYEINQLQYSTSEYTIIRQFFDELLEKQEEIIVLKKL